MAYPQPALRHEDQRDGGQHREEHETEQHGEHDAQTHGEVPLQKKL